MHAFWVFIGGGTGAVMRWWMASWLAAPWGTVGVNILGSAILAALMHPALALGTPWRLALGTGMMGGFTTYSTFNLDVLLALQAGDLGRAAMTASVTLLGCLAGAALGWYGAGMVASA